jgi:hypothetical protein
MKEQPIELIPLPPYFYTHGNNCLATACTNAINYFENMCTISDWEFLHAMSIGKHEMRNYQGVDFAIQKLTKEGRINRINHRFIDSIDRKFMIKKLLKEINQTTLLIMSVDYERWESTVQNEVLKRRRPLATNHAVLAYRYEGNGSDGKVTVFDHNYNHGFIVPCVYLYPAPALFSPLIKLTRTV